MSAQEADANFLLHKTLTDGTTRYTISAPSGLNANAAATTTDAVCPGYQDVYKPVLVASGAGGAHCGHDAERALSPATSPDDDFTLELHEDHGMFIVFSTPTFYKVSSEHVQVGVGSQRPDQVTLGVGGHARAAAGCDSPCTYQGG